MESLWPGSPPIGLSISKDGEQQGSHHPTRTNLLLATAALIMNAARIFKPLTTAIDKGPTNINSTMTGLGKFCSLSSHMAGWQGILHLLKWLVLFLFRIAGQADSVPQRAKSVLSSCISEERSPVGRQMRANSSLEWCLFFPLYWQTLQMSSVTSSDVQLLFYLYFSSKIYFLFLHFSIYKNKNHFIPYSDFSSMALIKANDNLACLQTWNPLYWLFRRKEGF